MHPLFKHKRERVEYCGGFALFNIYCHFGSRKYLCPKMRLNYFRATLVTHREKKTMAPKATDPVVPKVKAIYITHTQCF